MKNKTIKLELITAAECCPPSSQQACCEPEQDCDTQCNCNCTVYSSDTDAGKTRAKELGATSFPAIAINGILFECEPIAKAIATALQTEECCCC